MKILFVPYLNINNFFVTYVLTNTSKWYGRSPALSDVISVLIYKKQTQQATQLTVAHEQLSSIRSDFSECYTFQKDRLSNRFSFDWLVHYKAALSLFYLYGRSGRSHSKNI